jgi:hypothetical protein
MNKDDAQLAVHESVVKKKKKKKKKPAGYSGWSETAKRAWDADEIKPAKMPIQTTGKN